MSSIKLIVGLANPGLEYTGTRHNTGARYITLLSDRFNCSLQRESKFFGYVARIFLEKKSIFLLVPNTFMNLSGTAVVTIASFYRFLPEEILIVHDEMKLSPGIAKFKQGGGHSGHNGLRDIITKLGSKNFYRLRIGIGHPRERNQITNFVLGKPSHIEQGLIDYAINEAIFCIELWLKEDKNKAIQRLDSLKR